MIIIFEGCDRVGKNTQIQFLKQHATLKCILFHELHYTADIVKDIFSNNSTLISMDYYEEMFKTLNWCADNNISIICNRAHLGEYVYAEKYRGYSGDYVFDIENMWLKENKNLSEKIRLIVLTDDPYNLFSREDGNSLGKTMLDKTEEVKRFSEAYEKSNIKNKIIINIEKKTGNQVHEEVKRFLFSGVK